MEKENVNVIANKLAKELWNSEHLECFGNLEVKLQEIVENLTTSVNLPRFLFGEWVLVDKEKSGQIIECYENSCVIDENGMWTEYEKHRLTKDIRYLTPSEYYELNECDTNNKQSLT